MNYLPRILRENVHSNLSGEGNFPKINFRKLAANRNKRLYLLLNMVKWVFSVCARKPQKIETGTKQIIKPIKEKVSKMACGSKRFVN